MALVIVQAINAAGCTGYSASYEGASTFNIFYPDDVCSCILDSDTGVSTPFSSACGFTFACNGTWAFEWTWCPVSLQPYCLEESVFGPEAVTITFDDLPHGVLLSDEFAGLLFEHAVVDASGFSVTPPNKIVSDLTIVPRPAIRVTFDLPVLRVGCTIDNDGFTGERQPQLLACGTGGSSVVCDFEQGPDFTGIELPDCERIALVELGGFAWGFCRWGGMDGFDNLVFVPAVCGDMDANRLVDSNDLGISVQTLLGLDSETCHLAAADVNADGLVDGHDIESFVACVVP